MAGLEHRDHVLSGGFGYAPPAYPRLWFTDKHLIELAMWGQRTVFCGDGDVGQWTVIDAPEDVEKAQYARERIAALPFDLQKLIPERIGPNSGSITFPKMHIAYEQFGGDKLVWRLTSTVAAGMRLGIWPD